MRLKLESKKLTTSKEALDDNKAERVEPKSPVKSIIREPSRVSVKSPTKTPIEEEEEEIEKAADEYLDEFATEENSLISPVKTPYKTPISELTTPTPEPTAQPNSTPKQLEEFVEESAVVSKSSLVKDSNDQGIEFALGFFLTTDDDQTNIFELLLVTYKISVHTGNVLGGGKLLIAISILILVLIFSILSNRYRQVSV
jgi:hypothetical protein